LTRVVDLLYVKEPQAPRGPLSKIYRPFPVQKKEEEEEEEGRDLAMS
jgi:hypothetical protein